MKTLPQRLKQDLKEGKTTLHEAAVRMHIAGFFNFVDEEGTKKYLENEKD